MDIRTQQSASDYISLRRGELRLHLSELANRINGSISTLAKEAGMPNSTLTRFMNQDTKHLISLETMDKVCRAAGFKSYDDFIATLHGNHTEMEWDDAIYNLAFERAEEAVKRTSTKLTAKEFHKFVFDLYHHAYAENRAEGKPTLTITTAQRILADLLHAR